MDLAKPSIICRCHPSRPCSQLQPLRSSIALVSILISKEQVIDANDPKLAQLLKSEDDVEQVLEFVEMVLDSP